MTPVPRISRDRAKGAGQLYLETLVFRLFPPEKMLDVRI